MPSPSARRGAFFVALLALTAAATAVGCLFAPDRCADLLQCGKAGNGGSGGGGGAGGDGATSGDGVSATSTAGVPFTPCGTDAECLGGPQATCDPVAHRCRDCSTEDCRAPKGATCAVDSACATGRCVMGTCIGCMTDDQCTTLSCVAGICKAATGAPCAANGDCLGGECRFGLCRANIGHACTIAAECFNGVCTMNTCQACFDDVDCPGTACGTGKELGRCLLPQGAGCWPDSQMIVSCYSGPCTGFPATCQ